MIARVKHRSRQHLQNRRKMTHPILLTSASTINNLNSYSLTEDGKDKNLIDKLKQENFVCSCYQKHYEEAFGDEFA